MSQYRDDLVAARIRCAGLEAELDKANQALGVAQVRTREAERQIDALRDASPAGRRWVDGRWVRGDWVRPHRGPVFIALVACMGLLLVPIILVGARKYHDESQASMSSPPFELLLMNSDLSSEQCEGSALPPGNRYDDVAADEQMRAAAARARECLLSDAFRSKGGTTAAADAFVDSLQVAVVFEPATGRATSVSLVSGLVGSKTGDCITQSFMRARIQPFVGRPRAQSVMMGQTSKSER